MQHKSEMKKCESCHFSRCVFSKFSDAMWQLLSTKRFQIQVLGEGDGNE